MLTLPKAAVARVGVVDVGVSFSADDGYVQTRKGGDVPPTGSAEELLKAGFTNDGGWLARSFLKFPGTSSYRGQQVLSAKLRLRNYYSSSCSDAKILAQQVTTKVTFKQLSWGNQPKVTTARQASFDPAYGWSGSCPAADAVWDVQRIVADWAAGGTNHGFRIAANSETNPKSWRKYRSSDYGKSGLRPVLSVTYNPYPNTPTGLAVDGKSGGTITSVNPKISAVVSDPGGQKVRLYAEVSNTSGGVWKYTSDPVSSGSRASVEVKSTLAWRKSYTVAAWAQDASGATSKSAASTSFTTNSVPGPSTDLAVTPLVDGVSNARPVLSALAHDDDAGQALTAEFKISSGGVVVASGTDPRVGPGPVSWQPGVGALTDGQAYTWTVRAFDTAGDSGLVSGDGFTVDAEPGPAPVITASAYTDGQWTDPAPSDNVFTFTGAADTSRFTVVVDGGAPVNVNASAGSAQWAYSPASGWHTLVVTATDAVGNTSDESVFAFGAGSGVSVTSPEAFSGSATSFVVDAVGPAGASQAELSWRSAQGGDWVPFADVDLTQTASSSVLDGFVWDITEAGPEALPALTQLRVSFNYAEAKTATTVVQAAATGFGTAAQSVDL
ncbi:MAG: DNRLRE domain-containing protein, partial [Thiobacillus sp.]|nr:DNRLRE domain-containing protein [Thiobacillus sp.]